MARDRSDQPFDFDNARDDDDPPPRRGGRRRDRDDDYDDYEDDYEDRPRGSPPPNYLAQSILVTLCCCLIGGVVAIIHAAQVNSKWQQGDYAGARKASETAKMWCWLSFGIGIVTNAIAIVVQMMMAQQGGGFK
ncbi:MAG: CD225/dispanin family protein [Planctomycetia bacterium]|nr:CD225/dispanin family protein [Planctomycetia bacterium]